MALLKDFRHRPEIESRRGYRLFLALSAFWWAVIVLQVARLALGAL